MCPCILLPCVWGFPVYHDDGATCMTSARNPFCRSPITGTIIVFLQCKILIYFSKKRTLEQHTFF